MINYLRCLLVTLILSGPSVALAQGFTVGATVGQTSIDELGAISCGAGVANSLIGPIICEADDEGDVLGINLGYQFNQTFGLELGYADLDDYATDIIIGGDAFAGRATAAPEVRYAAVTGSLPITERFSVSGRVGYFDLDGNVTAFDPLLIINSDFDPDIISDSDVYAGASLNFAVTDKLTTQLRYDDFGVEAVTFGLAYRFGD